MRAQRGVDTSLGNYYSAYLNDSFEPRSNLSISVGLRYAREELQSDGYKSFDPRSERELYDSTVLQRLEQCYEELGCANSPNTVCYQACFYREYIQTLGLLTVHPMDDPALVLPRDENGEIVPGSIPQCNRAVNYKNCESLWITRNVSEYVVDNQLALRDAETFNITNDSFAPRISANWDPRNDAKTRVFASWGRYYGNTFLAPLVDENGPDEVVSVTGLDPSRVPSDNNQGVVPQSLIPSSFTVRMIDRDLEQQRAH